MAYSEGALRGGGAPDPSRGPSSGNDPGEDDYSISKLRRQYLDFAAAKREEIKEMRISRHYYHGDQWSEAELKVLKKRRQPKITRNHIGRKIDAVVGLIERLRQDPKAYPRSPPPHLAGSANVVNQQAALGAPPPDMMSAEPPPVPGAPVDGNGGGPVPPPPLSADQPPGMPPGMGPEPPAADPEAVTGQDPQDDGPDIATAAIRYTLDASDWQSHSSEVGRGCAINGLGGIELSLEFGDHARQKPFGYPAVAAVGAEADPEISMAEVDADTFFYDPRSVRLDFSDARYMGIAKWVDLDLAKEMFPDEAAALESLISSGAQIETWQQRDREKRWIDIKDKRVFLIEHWYIRKGQWRYCFYVADHMLMRGDSPFFDHKGNNICRFVMFSAAIDHDGDRYGFVRNLKPLQDEINARASKALHLINVRRVIMENGAVSDIETVRQEAVRPDGVVEVNPGFRFEFDDMATNNEVQGQLHFLEESKSELENFGPNPALIGQGIENKSGRAIALLQQAGIAELGPFILAYRSWKLRVYRIIHTSQQRYWTNERWIRVTDNEGLAKFLMINGADTDEFGYPKLNEWGQPMITNALGDLDVDIILDEGPDTISQMMDTYDTLTSLAQQGTQIPPQVLLELAPLDAATKRKLMGILEKAQTPDPDVTQVNRAGAVAKIDKLSSESERNRAQAAKTSAEVPDGPAKAAKNKATAYHEISQAVIDQHQAEHPDPFPPSPSRDDAGPDDGGLGQFRR